jgi:precorrin-2 dehydrogenase/sirohydrochlorin ferrochelatase
VGAGAVGEGKIGSLLDTGACIRVVALRATAQVRRWAQAGALRLEQRAFRPADLKDVFLAVAATSRAELNRRIYAAAQRSRVLCNVVDVPELCDFFYPAVVRRGDLQIAISTAGQSPSLASRIRRRLQAQFGPEYAARVAQLGKVRREVLGSGLPAERKRQLLRGFAAAESFDFRSKQESRAKDGGRR